VFQPLPFSTLKYSCAETEGSSTPLKINNYADKAEAAFAGTGVVQSMPGLC